jgi:hypothetical protein
LAPGFVEWNDGNVANYDIALTEAGGGGKYTGTFPAAITAGDYSIVIYKGSAFDGSDEPVGGDSVYWDGTVLQKMGRVLAILASDGMSSLTIAEPSGDPDGWSFEQKLLWLIMRFLNKHTSDNFNGIRVHKADSSISTTQPVTEAGGVKTVGKAT